MKETVVLMMTKSTQILTYHFTYPYQNIAERGEQHQSGNYLTKIALSNFYQQRVCAVVTDEVYMVPEWCASNEAQSR